MIEIPEEKYLRERIENHLRPLNNRLDNLDKEITRLADEQTMGSEALIKQMLKQTDLFTRIKVFLEMEYLNATIEPNTAYQCTDEQWQKAHEKALDQVNYIIHMIQQWEKDKAPLCPPEENENKSRGKE